ncbi:organic solute transporter alpha-like protein [Anopheles aquasalis]|uniref:organic solute transporter alpha-like protein n=1 Tax=Anopheles aquasalis TaxID=42839 RepID=UPI00215A3F83|nr:organic solute transporter alpha-like protein [Anopheles aquasalis]
MNNVTTGDAIDLNGSTSINCRNFLPPLEVYYDVYAIPLAISLIIGGVIWLWVAFAFVQVIRRIKRMTEKNQVMVLIIANTVYLTVVTFNVVALVLPPVAVVCDIIAFLAFCWCILVFFRFLKKAVGGDSVILALYESKAATPPPVCPCFRFIYDKKRQLTAIRFGIIQLPFYNSVVAAIQLIIYSIDKDLFSDVFYIILPFIIASIVLYVGASASFIKTVAPLYPENPIFKRFFLLQLVLIITKPQIIILELIYNAISFECTEAGEPKVYVNMIKQLLILIEVAIVVFYSYRFYTKELQPSREKEGTKNSAFEA